MKKKPLKYKAFFTLAIFIFLLLFLAVTIKKERTLTSPENFLKSVFTGFEKIINTSKIVSEQNPSNQEEGTLLKETRLEELQRENEELKKTLELNNLMTTYEKENATTITRNKSYWFQTLTIDKGKKNGIKDGMAVITKDGLIGKIEHANYDTSEVKLITSTDVNNNLSVSIETKTGVTHALLNGQDEKKKYLVINGVDKEAEISLGAKVYTSGLGGVFPAGIYIGTVEKMENEHLDISKRLYVNANQDYNNIRFVSVLKKEVRHDD